MDPKWLDGLRRGEAAAFDAVYAHYHRRLHQFLVRLSGRRDLADDLFQDTWMKLARHATTLASDTDLGAWLFTVARNAYYSHRRWVLIDAGRRREIEAEPAPSAERWVEDRRAMIALERALAELPAKDREALLLVGVEGMEQERAAAVMGLSYDAFRQRLSRARAQLAEKLAIREKGVSA